MRIALQSWQAWALLSAVFAALTAVFAKLGVTDLPADVATFIRTVLILALLGAILLVSGEWRGLSGAFTGGGATGRSLAFLLLSGVATGASWLCYFRALKLGNASQVAPIDKLSVVMVAIFGALFLGEHLSLPNWAGVALIAGGAVLVAYKG
jgi:transporter family protein